MNKGGTVFLSSEKTARRWGISDRRVRLLCERGQVAGAVRDGKLWKIPPSAKKPRDGRTMRAGYLPVSVKYENRRAYYDAFTAYHRGGDVAPMVGIFAESERQRLQDVLSAVG